MLPEHHTSARRCLRPPQACEAAEYLIKLPDRIRKLTERQNARKAKTKPAPAPFSWVFDRPVDLL